MEDRCDDQGTAAPDAQVFDGLGGGDQGLGVEDPGRCWFVTAVDDSGQGREEGTYVVEKW
jgi:hypothetical protein